MKSILVLLFSLVSTNALVYRYAAKMEFSVSAIKTQRSQLEKRLKEKLNRQTFLTHDLASRRAGVRTIGS